jgi:glucuronoarabinoxylan endo-1,4-beta-xylanase
MVAYTTLKKTTSIQKSPEKTSVLKSLVIALALSAAAARGGVIVTQNSTITNWSAGALIATVADPPGINATTGENNFGTANVAQTFTAQTNIVLTNIQMFVSGTAQTFNLHLFDLGTGYAANSGNPSPYTPGSDLFSGIQLAFTASTGNGFVINLAFTGADQVLLGNGHKYAFELEQVSGGPMTWYRTGGDIYANGDAYRDRSLINGNKRDFALAVFGTPATNSLTTAAAQCTVDWNDVHQRIDGFGASSAWRTTWTNHEADMFFSTNSGTAVSKNGTNFSFNGIALSLLRSRINPTGGTDESSIMQMAQARGAKVWSTPWTPPPQYKDSGVLDGGNYLGGAANNLAYARYLANYVVQMKSTYGVNICAISIQNEPDSNHPDPGGYESCLWTAQQIHDFVTNLYPVLIASNVASTKIIIPESENWAAHTNLYTTAMNDMNVAPMVSIIANHNYDGMNGTTAAIPTYGKALWETEVSLLSGSDSSITNAVYYAQRIHSFLTIAQVNAWHYWWLEAGNSTGNESLTDVNFVPAKRMYALGNFSRFVRPDFYRIGVVNNSSAQISAYKGASGAFAIVAINGGGTDINQTFILTNCAVGGSVTPWMTTSNLSLVNQTAVAVAGSSFTCDLPAMSIVTFVGQAANNPPALAPVSDKTINAGATLLVTNVAADLDSPPQTLTFNLLNGPPGAALNSSNGVFTWRPSVGQADTTNIISIQVADDGSPSLAATNNFNVIVNLLAQPVINFITISNGQVSLLINGTQGPDYTLFTSTNLTNWHALFTTNSPMLPLMLVDTNFSDAMRFYRIQIGP